LNDRPAHGTGSERALEDALNCDIVGNTGVMVFDSFTIVGDITAANGHGDGSLMQGQRHLGAILTSCAAMPAKCPTFKNIDRCAAGASFQAGDG
jgi:hypothetical protein